MTRKFCTTVRDKVKLWLGAPVVSSVLMSMLYVPSAAALGTVMVASKDAVDPVLTTIGFAGLKVQVAPSSALVSQVALIFPL